MEGLGESRGFEGSLKKFERVLRGFEGIWRFWKSLRVAEVWGVLGWGGFEAVVGALRVLWWVLRVL